MGNIPGTYYDGESALTAVAREPEPNPAHVEVTKLLLRHGADVNLPAGSNRHTPLHEAVSTNPDDESVLHGIRLVRILLDNGADVTAATHTEGHVPGRVRMRGITPIDEVYEEDPRMRKLFRKYFAIVVRRCAFRDLPADLANHVASFLMPDVAWFLM